MMFKRFAAALLLALGLSSGAEAACTGGALPFQLQNNTVADATQVMANFNQILSGVAANCAGSGANSDITSISGLTTPLSKQQGGTTTWIGGTSTGSANAQVVASVTPATGFTLAQGNCVQWIPGFTNTGAINLNVFGTGAQGINIATPAGRQQLTGGEIVQFQTVITCWDGFFYILMTPSAQFGGFGPLTNLASAATTDLGTVPSHNVAITGTTTITSFGSSASTTYPIYRISFAASLTLTNGANLVLPGGVNIVTAANDFAFAMFNGGSQWLVISYERASGLPVVTPVFPPGSLFDCTLSSAGGSQTLGIGTNKCVTVSDDASTTMTINSAFTKTFANFVAGTGNGALDTGTIANNTWYSVYEIFNPTTAATDYLFSLQPVAGGGGSPTLPSGFTKKRRIGSIKTDGTPNIIAFFQNGDDFWWGTPPALDLNSTSPVNTAVSVTLNTPVGVRTLAKMNADIVEGGNNSTNSWLLSSLDVADVAPSQTASPLATLAVVATAIPSAVGAQAQVWTNQSAQIRSRASTTNTGVTFSIQTLGWLDLRGKQF